MLFKKQRKRIFSIFLYIAAAANSVSHRLSSNGKLRQAGLRNRRDNGEKEEEEEEEGAAVGNSIDANNRPIALRAFTVHTGGKERERESTKGTTMCRFERGGTPLMMMMYVKCTVASHRCASPVSSHLGHTGCLSHCHTYSQALKKAGRQTGRPPSR